MLSAPGEDFTSVVALSNVVARSKRLQTMLLVTRSMLLVRGMPVVWRDAKNREQIGRQEQMLNEPAICLRSANRDGPASFPREGDASHLLSTTILFSPLFRCS